MDKEVKGEEKKERKFSEVLNSQYFTLISILTTMAYFGGLVASNPDFFDMVPLTITDYFVYFFKLVQVFALCFVSLFVVLPFYLMLKKFKDQHLKKTKTKRELKEMSHKENRKKKIEMLGLYSIGVGLIVWAFMMKIALFMIIGINYVVILPVFFRAVDFFHYKEKEFINLVFWFSISIIVMGFLWGIFDSKYENPRVTYDIQFTSGRALEARKVWAFDHGILIEVSDKNRFVPWVEIASIQTQKEQAFTLFKRANNQRISTDRK